MQVLHLLVPVVAAIRDHAIAGGRDARHARDHADGAHERGLLGVAGLLVEVVPGHVGAARDHEDVDRRLRLDVVEGEDMRVLVDLPARDLPAQDVWQELMRREGISGVSEKAARGEE